MPALLGFRRMDSLPFAVAGLLLCSIYCSSTAQPLLLDLSPSPPPEYTAPHVGEISGTMATQLEQAKALAASRNWDEAATIFADLIADDSRRVVRLDDNNFVSLRTYCNLQIVSWPAEGLAAYRRRVDPQAERLYRDGLQRRDESLLRRIVDETYASSSTDDALLALGEFALERADFDAARRAWEQLSPLMRDPSGRPLWIALDGLDLDKHWTEIESRWHERAAPPHWLAYPDSPLDLAEIRARLVLVSIRAGELERASLELEAFRRFHPDADGKLGGQSGKLADLLERLAASAREWKPIPRDANWPTFAGSPRRSHVADSLGATLSVVWRQWILESSATNPPNSISALGARDRPAIESGTEDNHRFPPGVFPVIRGADVIFGDAQRLQSLNLKTGAPSIHDDSVVYQVENMFDDSTRFTSNMLSRRMRSAPRFTLNVARGVLYARMGRVDTFLAQIDSGPVVERLIGLDLDRDGLLTFQIKPQDSSWAFDGAPLANDRQVFVAMRHSDVTPQAYVGAFDSATGKPLWQTAIGGANSLVDAQGREATCNLLTLDGERLYFNTNLGLVAALRASDGAIEWIRRYPRASGRAIFDEAQSAYVARSPSPGMVDNGLLFVAPADSPLIFALDSDTGQMIWSTDKLPDAAQLLGVVDRKLIVSGYRLCTVDAKTGRLVRAWPESLHAGVRGMGRGVIAGNEIFWPTRSEILVFDLATGVQTRPPLDLAIVGGSGANLVASGGYLVVLGRNAIAAFGPPSAPAQPSLRGEPTAARTPVEGHRR